MPQILGHCQAHPTRFKSQGAGHHVVPHFVMGDLQCMVPYSSRKLYCHVLGLSPSTASILVDCLLSFGHKRRVERACNMLDH
ncbi:hypothetical protein D3C87_1403760 [compost metagenome]